MKIKLFYQKHNESLDDFEYRVNQFTLSVSVIDIKFQEATYGNIITIQGDRTLYDELVKYLLSGKQPNWVACPSAFINLSDIIAITKEK